MGGYHASCRSCQYGNVRQQPYYAPSSRRVAPPPALMAATSRWIPLDLDASSLYVALDARTDTYAFGLVLYEILHGVIAFLGFPGIGAMLLALEGQRPLLELRHEHARLGDLIESCWHTDPAKRPSMERVIETLDEEVEGYLVKDVDFVAGL